MNEDEPYQETVPTNEFVQKVKEVSSNNGWYPKETAPKDGSWFLVLSDENMCWGPYNFVAWEKPHPRNSFLNTDLEYERNINGYFCGTDTSDEIEFEWWRPLPELPVTAPH